MFLKGASPAYRSRALLLLIVGFVTMYFTGMFGTDIINAIQAPIMERLGCTATEATIGWTIGGYLVIAVSFVFSTIIMRKSIRLFAAVCFFVMAGSALLVGVGYTAKSVWLIALGGVLLKNFVQALQLCVFTLIANWFEKTRGLVLGLMGASFALDNSTSSSGLTILFRSLGFGGMIAVAAVIMAVLGVVMLLFVRNHPSEVGLTVDGVAPKVKSAAEEDGTPYQTIWSLGRLLSKKESWSIIIGIGVFNFTLVAVISQFFGSLMGMGVAQETCMTYMLIFGLLGIVMAPLYGKLVDLIGAPKTGVVAGILYALAVAGFVFRIPVLGAIGLTVFVGAPVLQPAITIHVFGAREYQATNRYLQIIVNIITACALPFMTLMFDATGSYDLAYQIILGLNLLALVMMAICRKTYIDEAA